MTMGLHPGEAPVSTSNFTYPFDLPNCCLDDQYILDLPIRIEVSEEQAHPYWQVDMTTKWAFRKPDVVNWSEP